MIKIPAQRLQEGPETVEFNLEASELDLDVDEYKFHGRVGGTVEFTLVGRDVRATGRLEAHATAPCIRCLKPVAIEIAPTVDSIWLYHDPQARHYEEPLDEEILAEYYDGQIVYPEKNFRELILCELPDLPLCAPDCRGLCQGCGADLNREACRCVVSQAEAGQPEPAEWKAALRRIVRGSD
jgi:uncharacterized protein